MFLRGSAVQRRGAADQQAKVLTTLDQAEKVLGGAHGLVDTQLTGLVGLSQQTLHLIEQALRAGIKKQLRQCGILRGHRHHHPVQFDGFAAIDQLMKAARDILQHPLDRCVLRQFEQ